MTQEIIALRDYKLKESVFLAQQPEGKKKN